MRTFSLFRVTDENIKTVRAEIDRGGLYRSRTFTNIDKAELYAMQRAGDAAFRAGERAPEAMAKTEVDNRLVGADVVMPYGTDDRWVTTACWKLENGFTETYGPDISYDFWAEYPLVDEDTDMVEWYDGPI